ncbi:type VII secretion target [Kitasatospora sp. NPDC049258]|uniref:type VII secretion target n=1 Tax=Kitasatospora sp. NPDC049258 TaxID=3155394 RepID=UPI00343C584F
MHDIHVRTAGLHSASEAVRTSSTQLGGRTGHWLDGSLTAAAAHGEWWSGPALRECADAWQTHMTSVVQQLHTYADQLRDSAHSYDAAEQEAARRLDQASRDLNAGV